MQKSDYVEKLLNQILFPLNWLPDTVTRTTDMLTRWVEMRGDRGEFEMDDFCPPPLMGQLAILSGPALPVQSRFPKGFIYVCGFLPAKNSRQRWRLDTGTQ
ncbi:hypothetical protein D5086_024972 [Populus alba]|uniref:Uncharacterized protein n=1 Tax=Populus alba TaxID=43335 RepID=A0ACC4B8I3_POPAL